MLVGALQFDSCYIIINGNAGAPRKCIKSTRGYHQHAKQRIRVEAHVKKRGRQGAQKHQQAAQRRNTNARAEDDRQRGADIPIEQFRNMRHPLFKYAKRNRQLNDRRKSNEASRCKQRIKNASESLFQDFLNTVALFFDNNLSELNCLNDSGKDNCRPGRKRRHYPQTVRFSQNPD